MNATAQVNMIKQQLRTSNVLDESILALFETLSRQDFVPSAYQDFAYSDMHIPLPHQQCMMTPAEEGLMLQALELQGHERVLEIGTGSAYFTALLSRQAKEVISYDVHPDFIALAQEKLAKHHCHNVELIHGNAYEGDDSRAPYDCIIIHGAVPKISDKFLLQLTPQGRLIACIGTATTQHMVLYRLQPQKAVEKIFLFDTSLPALTPMTHQTTFVF
jgi:protein-L-isoaspartate(D-aspartate) O-methyltransferase